MQGETIYFSFFCLFGFFLLMLLYGEHHVTIKNTSPAPNCCISKTLLREVYIGFADIECWTVLFREWSEVSEWAHLSLLSCENISLEDTCTKHTPSTVMNLWYPFNFKTCHLIVFKTEIYKKNMSFSCQLAELDFFSIQSHKCVSVHPQAVCFNLL